MKKHCLLIKVSMVCYLLPLLKSDEADLSLGIWHPTRKGKGKTIERAAEDVSSVEDPSSAEMQDSTGDEHEEAPPPGQSEYSLLPSSSLKSYNAELSLGIQCCMPPTRKGKGKGTKGIKPAEVSPAEDPSSSEEIWDDNEDNQKRVLPARLGKYTLLPPSLFEKQ